MAALAKDHGWGQDPYLEGRAFAALLRSNVSPALQPAIATAIRSAGNSEACQADGAQDPVPSPALPELGYLLSGASLRESDATLDADHVTSSSIRSFAEESLFELSRLLRGPASVGTLLHEQGYPSVPSTDDPAPGADEPYFNGGTNTVRHGCRSGGSICGLQIEAYFEGARDTRDNRAAFARALVRAYETFLGQHMGLSILSPAGEVVIDSDESTTTNQSLDSRRGLDGGAPPRRLDRS